MKKIMLITLGGTISAKGSDRLDLKDYQSGLIPPEQYINDLPEIKNIAHVNIDSYDNISSTDITSFHWLELRNKVIHYFEKENYDGIVISHGTSTLEETAYFLHLTVPSKKPIVFVGAQRPYTALSSDAPLNLLQAIQVATSEKSHGKGVLVVLNDTISSAREITKENTYRLDAFQLSPLSTLGLIDPDQTIHYYRKPTRLHTYSSVFSKINFPQSLPNVAIVYSYAGATGDLISYINSSNKYKGIIVAGTGAGLVSSKEEKALLKTAQKGLFIVRSSRVGEGRVVDIERFTHKNFIHADNLTPQKARILLMLSIMKSQEVKEIQQYFNDY